MVFDLVAIVQVDNGSLQAHTLALLGIVLDKFEHHADGLKQMFEAVSNEAHLEVDLSKQMLLHVGGKLDKLLELLDMPLSLMNVLSQAEAPLGIFRIDALADQEIKI